MTPQNCSRVANVERARLKLKKDDFTRLDGRWGTGWEGTPSGSLLAKIYLKTFQFFARSKNLASEVHVERVCAKNLASEVHIDRGCENFRQVECDSLC